ncbi:MAG: hypothetical protein OXT09_29800 [Myxococcales bacterium]|nr:hypothetical protein [Myxococcales bacterium]
MTDVMRASIAGLLMLAVACGGDDGDGGAEPDSAMDGSSEPSSDDPMGADAPGDTAADTGASGDGDGDPGDGSGGDDVTADGSDTDASGGAAGGAAPPDVGATCQEGQLIVRGTLDGEAVDFLMEDSAGHSFVNALSNTGMLEYRADTATLSMTFDQLLPNGGSVEARGGLVDGALDVGNCDEEGAESPSTLALDDDGDGGTFKLRDLRRAPYCEGEVVEGTLDGCFRYRSFGF